MSELQVDLTHAGVSSAALRNYAATLDKALRALDQAPAGDFLRIVRDPAVLREIRAYAKRRPAGITDVVQLGIGGSSLGAQALCAALLQPRHNQFVRRPGLRFHFPDNIDPQAAAGVAIARVEQLHPWPDEAVAAIVRRYAGAETVTWVQEEPANMGAWTFVRERIQDALLPGQKLAYAGRRQSASPATGSRRVHLEEQATLIATAFAGIF